MQGVREMAAIGLPIFLDLKLHDIPNTVAKAVQALRALEPAILTVHAAGGRAMMEDAKAAAPLGTKVVAVTVLTSLDGADLDLDRARPPIRTRRSCGSPSWRARPGSTASSARATRSRRRARRGRAASSSSPACARPDGDIGDQKRVMTPRAALDAGASILVVGRPITAAEDPDAAARAIEATL